jgi:4-carboxymuconolactone decarboxylase
VSLLVRTLKGVHAVSDGIVEKTKKTGALYFKDVEGEKPFELWRAFDKELGKELSLFITGNLYAREKIPHTTRQLVTVGVLTVLGRSEELKLHIQAALNVGCSPREIAEVIFQTFTYGGIPTVNRALTVLRGVLKEKGQWPIAE